MRRFVSILVAVLFLTAAYVFVWPSANIPYFGVEILHLLAGMVFLIALGFAIRKIWPAATPGQRLGWLLLALGGLLGAVLIYTGTRRGEWTLLYTHMGACVAGCAILTASWAGKRGFLAGSYIGGIFR